MKKTSQADLKQGGTFNNSKASKPQSGIRQVQNNLDPNPPTSPNAQQQATMSTHSSQLKDKEIVKYSTKASQITQKVSKPQQIITNSRSQSAKQVNANSFNSFQQNLSKEKPKNLKQVVTNNNQLNENTTISNKLQVKQNEQKYQFFEIFDLKMIFKILVFLKMKDLVKFATLSSISRNLMPQILREFLAYYQTHPKLYTITLNTQTIEQIFGINQEYKRLMNKKLPEIYKNLEDLLINKDANRSIILDILLSIVNLFTKNDLKKCHLIQFILEQGVQNIFECLSTEYIVKYKKDEIIKPIKKFPSEAQDNSLNQLIKISLKYILLKQSIEIPIATQKKEVRKVMRSYEYSFFNRVRSKLLRQYSKPIKCLKYTSNVFDYINKNNIQTILSFLGSSEISNLQQSCQSMNRIVHEALNCLLSGLVIQRQKLLDENQLNFQQAQLVYYMMHVRIAQMQEVDEVLDTWAATQETVIPFIQFQYTDIASFFQNKNVITSEVNNENQQQFEEGQETKEKKIYKQLVSFLQKYPDSIIERGEKKVGNMIKKLDGSDRVCAIALQKYAKGVKLYYDLQLNKKTLDAIERIYIDNIFKIDQRIHIYEKFTHKQNLETLLLFTHQCQCYMGSDILYYNIQDDYYYNWQCQKLKRSPLSACSLIY